MRTTRTLCISLGLAIGCLGALGVETALAQDPPAEQPAADVARLIEQLGAPDFDRREAAEHALVKLGASAVPALEQALEGTDPEVRRRARRALARIRDRAHPRRPDPLEPPAGWQRVRPRRDDPRAPGADPLEDFWRRAFGGHDPLADVDRLFDALFRELRGHDPDVDRPAAPGGDRRGEDPLRGLDRWLDDLLREGGRGGLPDDAEWRRQMDEARKRMEETRRRLRELFGGADPFGGGADPFGFPDLGELFKRAREQQPHAGGGTSRSLSMSGDGSLAVHYQEGDTRIDVEKDPSGAVHVRVAEPDAGGAVRTQEWRAASEAALRAAHPDAARYFDRAMGGIRINPGGRGGFGFGFGRPSAPHTRPGGTRSGGTPGTTDATLGLTVTAVSEALRAQLELPEGQGLYVRRVEPGSWAARAGLRAHDVILTAAGASVARPADLAHAVGAASGDLTLTIVRMGERTTLTARAR